MLKPWEMLDKAYKYINENCYEEAREILDLVLSAEPQNVEAWAAYIHISNTESDLKLLRNHIIKIWKTRVRNDYLQATRRFVLQRLDAKMSSLQ